MNESLLVRLARESLGSEFEAIFDDPKRTIALLASENWKQRFVALLAIEAHCDFPTEEITAISKSLASDSNEQVARLALKILGRTNAGTFDNALSGFLADYVDRATTDALRKDAYLSLLQIRSPNERFSDSADLDRRIKDLLTTRPAELGRVPVEIDWNLIRTFSQSSSKATEQSDEPKSR